MSKAAPRRYADRLFNQPITAATAQQFQPDERPNNVKVALDAAIRNAA
jgi:hypothetical protein